MKPFNSVIIPVYNVASYLRPCLDSLVTAFRRARKSHPDFTAEVICVDDGSTDASGEILEAFVRETAVEGLSFKAFHQENAGPSVARNRGLDAASGTWLSFVDSDDEVMPDYFKAFLEWPHKADITFFSMKWCYSTGEEEIATLRGFELQQGRDAVAEVALKLTGVLHERNLFAFMPNKFIFNELVRQHHVRFIEGLSLSEDEAFIFEVCLCARSLSVMPFPLYNYKVLPTGLTNSPNRPMEWLSDIFYAFGERAKEQPLKKLAFGCSLAFLLGPTLRTVSLSKARAFARRARAVQGFLPLSRYCPRVVTRISSLPDGMAVLWMLFCQVRTKLARRLKD